MVAIIWRFGNDHPQKLFSILKANYVENLKIIKSLDTEQLARRIKQLIDEVKMCRAAQWKQHLKDQQLQRR
ncbi:hypothetical protein MBANPS3_012708, partial [Mucor bainieri]